MRRKDKNLLEEINEKLDQLLSVNKIIENSSNENAKSEISLQAENANEQLEKGINSVTIQFGEEEIDSKEEKRESQVIDKKVSEESSLLFKTQQEESQAAKEEFNKWKKYILELSKILGEDLAYDFEEILESGNYNIQKSKQILFLPLKKNIAEDLQILKDALNMIELDDENVKTILFKHENINIRTSGDLDYTLESTGPTSEVTNYAKNLLTTTFLLSLKQLRQSKKELAILLSETIKSQSELDIILKNPEALIELIESEFLENLQQEDWEIYNSKQIKRIQDASASILKAYKRCLKSIFKVYNEIWVRYEKFKSEVQQMSEEEEQFLVTWNDLFVAVLALMDKYLKEKLHICSISCQKGDVYNHIYHKPMGEGEPDDELANDHIKSVENIGFRFMATTEIEGSYEQAVEEFKPSQILLQTGVIVVLNK